MVLGRIKNFFHRLEGARGNHARRPALAATAAPQGLDGILARSTSEPSHGRAGIIDVHLGLHWDGRPQIRNRLTPPSGEMLRRI